MIPVERKGAMRSPGITPTNLEINPEFAARFRAHQPTRGELDDAIGHDLKAAGAFVREGSEIRSITYGYEENLLRHNTAERTIMYLVQRRNELLNKQQEANTNKFIDTAKLEEALALCAEELKRAIQTAKDTANGLPSQLAVEHYFNPSTNIMEWDQSKK